MLPLMSDTFPCKKVTTAPPRIAIISPDPPILVSSPRPITACPKMVGNMSDMNPEIETRAITPAIPLPKITVKVLIIAIIDAKASKDEGRKNFIRYVKINLEEAKRMREAT